MPSQLWTPGYPLARAVGDPGRLYLACTSCSDSGTRKGPLLTFVLSQSSQVITAVPIQAFVLKMPQTGPTPLVHAECCPHRTRLRETGLWSKCWPLLKT